MNYLGEIKLFYRWLQTRDIRPSTIAMWHGLMYIGYLEQWKTPMEVSVTKLVRYTNLPHTTLYRERDYLCEAGLLKVEKKGSNRTSLYTLISLETLLSASHAGTHSEGCESHGGTHEGENAQSESHAGTHLQDCVSHGGTHEDGSESHGGTHIALADTQEADSGGDASRARMRGVSVKKQDKSIHDMKEKETNKKKKRIEWREWLETGSQEPWKSILRLWLEYKEERNEMYSGAVSLGRLQSHLKNISGDNPAVAQQIVDRSIACNWKGLFPLDRAFVTPSLAASAPQQGQRIGQIMQPRSEEARSSVLDKFKGKANKNNK